MGCCVSSPKKKDKDSLNQHHRSGPEPRRSSEKPRAPSPKRTHVGSQAPPPPPPPFEEETVKEVLSETPAAPRKNAAVAEEREASAVARKLREDEAGTKVLISKLEEVAEIVSEYSEMCSASASLSTATTATEKRDNEVTSRDSRDLVTRSRLAANRSPGKAPRKRPNVGDLSAGRERRGPKSLPHSPARAPVGGPRSAVRGGRELSGELKPSSGRAGVVGEDSRRRQSRSPATRRNDIGSNRGGMGRRPVKESTEISRAAGRSTELGTAEDGRRKAEETDGGGGPEQGNESLDLDNPNVSLECFIFL